MMETLFEAAAKVRAKAYSPYSNYGVGAAVLGEDGNVYSGCNVENASYGLSICAERSAVFSMVASGVQKAFRCAVVTKDGGTPCGACLQVLLEFADDPMTFEVGLMDENGSKKSFTLGKLL